MNFTPIAIIIGQLRVVVWKAYLSVVGASFQWVSVGPWCQNRAGDLLETSARGCIGVLLHGFDRTDWACCLYRVNYVGRGDQDFEGVGACHV